MPENLSLEAALNFFKLLFSQIGIQDVHGVPFFILIVIFILVVFFLVIFLRTATLAIKLGSLARTLKKRDKSLKFPLLKQFSKNKLYKHLWSEYEETLHELKRKDGGTEWRSTLPAEAFFSKEVMVDSRAFIWNDFFRHLPGILTGLGIIGTFFGLIDGLEGFAPSEEASAARESLTKLLSGVKEAFTVSAFAITAAIIVTLLEKWSLTWAYKNVEKVTHAIDSLYDAGAGEEYLARMVEADESNLANAQQLKNAMVNELSTILREMTDRQIAAQEKNNQVLAQSIQIPLAGVAEKLEDVGAAVKGGTRDNTDTMKSALDELVSGFIVKMDETLNVSMQKIAGSMENSARSMTDMQVSMDTMIDKISSTSDQAITGMVEKLETAMERTANNQEQMTQQMEQFVSQLQKQIRVEREITNSDRKTQRDIVAAEQKQNRAKLSGSFDAMLVQLSQASTAMETNISKISNTTTSAISEMNRGAESMAKAAEQFDSAGKSVAGVLEKASPLASELNQASQVLGHSNQQLSQVFSTYQKLKADTELQVQELGKLVLSVQKESSDRQQLVADLNEVTAKLRENEKESVKYLEDITEQLKSSYEAFGTSMNKQVTGVFGNTNQHIESAVNNIGGAVKGLEQLAHTLNQAAKGRV